MRNRAAGVRDTLRRMPFARSLPSSRQDHEATLSRRNLRLCRWPARLGQVALLLVAPALPAWADGTITGTIKLAGPATKLAPIPVGKDPSVCGKDAPNEALITSPDGGLANVVVAVKTLKKTAAPGPLANAFIDQVKCRYSPHVQAVTVGTKLALINNDNVFHNVHATLAGGASPVTVFNLAMPFKGQKLPTTIKRPGLMKVRCDAGHTWMSAYVLAFDHAAFAVTDANGRFTIKDIPAGEHTLELWHEPLSGTGTGVTSTVTVKVADGATATVDAKLKL